MQKKKNHTASAQLFREALNFANVRARRLNPLVPRVQKKIKIHDSARLLIVELAKKTVHLGPHCSERQGLMG